MLTPEQRRLWANEGFLHFPGFFDDATVHAALDVHERIWRERPSDIAVDHLDYGTRHRLSDVGSDAGRRFKLNDLYLREPTILNLGLDARLVSVMEQVLVDRPALINSLDVDYGTQQAFHVDSLFMTPPTPGNLAAAWVALEDGHPDSGPLQYYPGSHLIWPYRFSTGTNSVIADEMTAWSKYMDEQVAAFGLKPTQLIPKKGDLFIWHAYLLHGGSKINDPKRTRSSSIFHYFSESAARTVPGIDLVALHGGFWMKKPPIFARQIQDTARVADDPSPARAAPPRMTLRGRLRTRLEKVVTTTKRRLTDLRG